MFGSKRYLDFVFLVTPQTSKSVISSWTLLESQVTLSIISKVAI